MKKISVIIPLFNKVNTVVRAIDSALAQQNVEVEVIVVDDGSTDGSVEVVQRYGNRIRLVQQENAGPAAARNHGVQLSLFRWLTFLDADDQFVPHALSLFNRSLDQYPDGRVFIGSFCYIGLDGQITVERLDTRIPGLALKHGIGRVSCFHARLVINVPADCLCIDKTLFEAIGGFDPFLRSWEISEFFFRLALAEPTFIIISSTIALVHQTPGSASTLTHHKTPYIQHYLRKLLGRMSEVPRSEQSIFLGPIKSFLIKLWDNGALSEFQELARLALPYFFANRQLDKRVIFSLLPLFILKRINASKITNNRD